MIASWSGQFSMCSCPLAHEVNLNLLLHLLAFPNLASTWHQCISSNQLHLFVHCQALKSQGRMILYARCSDSLSVFVLCCLTFLWVYMECAVRKKEKKQACIFWERQERTPSWKNWTSGILSFSFSFTETWEKQLLHKSLKEIHYLPTYYLSIYLFNSSRENKPRV